MRVAQLFKRVLGLGRERVVGVGIEGQGARRRVVVELALPARRRRRCSGCGEVVRARYDHQTRRWRHRDLAGARLVLSARIARVRCPNCGVRPQAVPFARAGARFTRAFEDTCAWLLRAAPRSVVAALMRVDWKTAGRIAERVVHEARAGGDGLDGLRRIGLDEVSYRRGHRYLVACHDTGRVVWCAPGERQAGAEAFFRALGPERCLRLEAISLDLAPGYRAACRRFAPQAAVCADPYHLVAQAGFALDRLRAGEWQRLRRQDPRGARWLKDARWALRRGPSTRTEADRELIGQLAQANWGVYRAWLWCDQLRAVLRAGDPLAAQGQLAELARSARDLGHPRFTRLGASLERHAQAIVNTVILGLSNGRLEALNSTVRLISNRARGFRRVQSLIALIHLTCGRIHVELPT
jgi:transposase